MLSYCFNKIMFLRAGLAIDTVTRQSAFENILVPILFGFTILTLIILIYFLFPQWFSRGFKAIKSIPTAISKRMKKKKNKNQSYTLDEIIKISGFAYDPKEDIFFSIMDPLQRKFGYCRLYDEAAASMNMIIDCEPIYFEYDDKQWMIELWKGQYGLTTGCEIGVYYTQGPVLNIPGVFNGTFYHCVSNADRLSFSYTLKKKGNVLFNREGIHWWLTGFKLGEFSNPQELVMEAKITLKNREMCYAFLSGLKNAGYSDKEIQIQDNTVSILFDKPHSQQPLTRTQAIEWMVQRYNQRMCEEYQKIAAKYDNIVDIFNAIQTKSPELYGQIVNIGKTQKLFEVYNTIKNYIYK